ncbi:MAG: hypothetical protein NVSMB6_16500 [Burkholderiaceae bacterium]
MGTYAPEAEEFMLHVVRIAKGLEQTRSRLLSRLEEPDLHAQLMGNPPQKNRLSKRGYLGWSQDASKARPRSTVRRLRFT